MTFKNLIHQTQLINLQAWRHCSVGNPSVLDRIFHRQENVHRAAGACCDPHGVTVCLAKVSPLTCLLCSVLLRKTGPFQCLIYTLNFVAVKAGEHCWSVMVTQRMCSILA